MLRYLPWYAEPCARLWPCVPEFSIVVWLVEELYLWILFQSTNAKERPHCGGPPSLTRCTDCIHSYLRVDMFWMELRGSRLSRRLCPSIPMRGT